MAKKPGKIILAGKDPISRSGPRDGKNLSEDEKILSPFPGRPTMITISNFELDRKFQPLNLIAELADIFHTN